MFNKDYGHNKYRINFSTFHGKKCILYDSKHSNTLCCVAWCASYYIFHPFSRLLLISHGRIIKVSCKAHHTYMFLPFSCTQTALLYLCPKILRNRSFTSCSALKVINRIFSKMMASLATSRSVPVVIHVYVCFLNCFPQLPNDSKTMMEVFMFYIIWVHNWRHCTFHVRFQTFACAMFPHSIQNISVIWN